jgi:hypothetical protein
MPRRVPLPAHLSGLSIRSSDAELHGIGRGRLRSSDVAHPFHGVSSVELDIDSVVSACRAFEPVLRPGNYFSHSTAAALWGIPLPASGGAVPLHLSSIGTGVRPRRNGIVGHLLADAGVSMVLGFPVVVPRDVWFQLAGTLSRENLVAAGDYLISGVRLPGGGRSTPLCSIDELKATVTRSAGRRGVAAAAWALSRVRTGVDSRMESLLRLLLVSGGIADLVIGPGIPVDGGRLTLHPDLAIIELRVLFEYEGDGHRTDARRFRADIHRRELFEAAGWRVIRVTADDIFVSPDAFLARVRVILAGRRRERAKSAATELF